MNAIEQIAITKIKGVGPKSSRLLLAYFGSLEEVFKSKPAELKRIPGITRSVIDELVSGAHMRAAEAEYRYIQDHGIELFWYEDDRFPRRLKNCDDAPMLLYSKGNLDLNKQRIVSVVGTRNATHYGRKLTEALLEGLSELDVIMVSGLAFGIDILAHRAAVEQKIGNVAVLGHGLDRIYPFEHRGTAEKILENGRLLSEFPSGTLPDRVNFPMRNRIIAGLSDVTVVVEAANKGGALITAEIANGYNRDVCAFPGPVDQPYSVGCNELIRTNKAHLIRHAEDLIQLMQWDLNTAIKKDAGTQLSLLADLNNDEERIFTYLKEVEHASIDELAIYCDWQQSKIALVLLEMEMKGIVQSLPGKIYKLP